MGKLLAFWNYLQFRINEPSTHASISSLLALAGLNLDDGIVHDVLIVLSIVFGGLGFFVKEGQRLS